MERTREEVAALVKESGEKIRETERLRQALLDVQRRLDHVSVGEKAKGSTLSR